MKTDGSDRTERAVARGPDNGVKTLQHQIQQMAEQFKAALPKTITPERMMRIVLTAIRKNPELAQCSTESFFGAVLTGLQLGLEINTPLGQCYIIPYKREVTFQLGYQGLLELAYRSNKYKRIDAEVVYKGDEFKYEYGLDAYLKHKPCGVRENPQYVYALYELTNGGKAFKVWTWKAVMKHAEEYSQSYGSASSPWKSKHLETVEAMAKKTLLISALKYAPKSVEIAQAITADESGVQAKIVEDGSHTFVDFDFKKPQIEAPNESLKAKPKAAAPAENQDEADGENEEAVPRKKRSVTNLFEKDEAAALEEQYERAMQRDYPDFA